MQFRIYETVVEVLRELKPVIATPKQISANTAAKITVILIEICKPPPPRPSRSRPNEPLHPLVEHA